LYFSKQCLEGNIQGKVQRNRVFINEELGGIKCSSWFVLSQARQFQREVNDRKQLEYRLMAFTGDDVTSSGWGSKTKTKNVPK